jgi:protein-tyrosine phosphatase
VGVNVAYGSFPFIRAPRSVGTVGRVANDALMVPERRIVLDNVHNFRDLGGYSTTDGRSIRWRMLFRADGLAGMSAADLEVMRELGLRTVIDLRSNKELDERGRFPHEDVPVSYHHFSVIDTTWTEDTERVVPDDEAEWLTWAYEQMLDRGAPRFADALRVLAEAEVYPAVFHCAAGKDRTGLLSALVLALLGVSDDDIVADYALTAEAMQRMREWIQINRPEGASLFDEVPSAYLSADPSAMRRTLARLTEEHGSIRSYVASIGVEAEVVEAIRDALLV